MEESNRNTRRAFSWLFSRFAAIAVPTAILALLLPAYAGYVALSGMFLMIMVFSFECGWEWDRPEWTREARRGAYDLLIGLLVAPLSLLIGERGSFVSLLIAYAAIPAAVFPAFFIARAISRRRR